MSKKIDVVMVSYLNTLPFIHGFKNKAEGDDFNLILATPRACAKYFEENKAEIALIPVGALAEIGEHKIVTNYCIGCDGKVRTVCLFFEGELMNINEVLMDNHSRTSVVLLQILMSKYFGQVVKYTACDIDNDVNLQKGQAVLAIGDKVFELEKKFKTKIDLGEAWKEWTNLPFAFAVFVAKTSISDHVIEKLNRILHFGIAHRDAIDFDDYQHIHALKNYLESNISYELNDKKNKALQIFLSETKEISL